MRKINIILCIVIALFCMVSVASAELTTIGTVTYKSMDYNLIWDNDNGNGQSVIWIDYSSALNVGNQKWQQQMDWVAGLDEELTYNLDGYSISWEEDSWRMPDAGLVPNTIAEMTHLHYVELGLGSTSYPTPLITNEELNATNFDNLINVRPYWTADVNAVFPNKSYQFVFGRGEERYNFQVYGGHVLPIRDASISAVPIPGAIWLLGSSIIGMIAIRKRN